MGIHHNDLMSPQQVDQALLPSPVQSICVMCPVQFIVEKNNQVFAFIQNISQVIFTYGELFQFISL